MVNEQHQMKVTKEKFLIFRQLRVSDIETTERFLLYAKSSNNCYSIFQSKAVINVEICCKINY